MPYSLVMVFKPCVLHSLLNYDKGSIMRGGVPCNLISHIVFHPIPNSDWATLYF